MAQQIENPALRNSKFVFDKILHMDIDFHRLNLTRGSSYISLPDWLMKKKAIINPRNSDMECFKWAIIAAMKWEEIGNNLERISKLKRYENEFDWNGLEFPICLRDISKFESRNEIGVNILAVENRKIYICRKGKDYDRTTNLMLITENNEKGNKKHYVAVKSLPRLLSRQNSKHKETQYFCTNCLNGFTSEATRDEHYTYCNSKDSVRVEMPTRNPIVKYSDGQYQFKVPFVIYANFESILIPVSGAANNPEMSSTRGINVHTPSGWCMYSKFACGSGADGFSRYRGRDCVSKFCKRIISEAKRLYNSTPRKPMDPLTNEEKLEFKRAKECHICFKELSLKDMKVRDHCHYTGKYRGAAHVSCNLRYRIPNYIPVVFHNLAGYDAHLFIKELVKHTTKTGVIAKNTGNYISFSVKVEVDKNIDKAGNEKFKEIELRFIDSFKVMSSSLDSLVNNLAKGGHEFWGFKGYNSEQRSLLIRKAVYPYEYMDSWDKFKGELPSIDKFYSKLNMSGISKEDYQHAKNVWDKFELKNMGDYHDLYLETDGILLANVFESFRKVCIENYGLDPAHFYTAPGLAWKPCLKKTGVNLELLKGPDMLLTFERGIRGGITQSVHRWAIANNPYMSYEYDTSKPTEYLQYLDANNLYGWAMSQPLPAGEFNWVEIKDLKQRPQNLKKTIDLMTERDCGYLLEVDVQYPKELHDHHNDLPFVCEKIRTEDFYKDISEDIEARFDTSGYVPDRLLPIGKNKKVIGLMKDELGGKIMKEFISLRPKMYSYRIDENGGTQSEPKKCKGIKKCVVKKTISFDDYKRCLLEGTMIHRSQMMFRSRKHKVKTLEVNKLVLSREDDKRVSIDGVASLGMGHYKV